MSKKVAILQSNYIPWKGYFDLINQVDEFILYDEMQYTRRDWRNRNKIKTPDGLKWLTIPVNVKGKYLQKINETMISDEKWNVKHWNTIKQNYSKSKHFNDHKEKFEQLYLNSQQKKLSDINFSFIKLISSILSINTHLRQSSDFKISGGKSEQLLNLCKQAGATEYISGPAAKDYLDEDLFIKNGITVSWMNYDNYPEYRQPYGKFEHCVTILDLIFNEGSHCQKYMKSFKGNI